MTGGRRVGFLGTFGLALGGYLHVIAAAARLSVVFHTVPTLYGAVKVLEAPTSPGVVMSVCLAISISISDRPQWAGGCSPSPAQAGIGLPFRVRHGPASGIGIASAGGVHGRRRSGFGKTGRWDRPQRPTAAGLKQAFACHLPD